jgi:hypothetical protein
MAPPMPSSQPSPPSADERVPLFGTWPRIYAAVVVSALVVMALVAVFSVFPY